MCNHHRHSLGQTAFQNGRAFARTIRQGCEVGILKWYRLRWWRIYTWIDNKIKNEAYDESETGYYRIAEIVNILVDEKYLAEDGNLDMEKMNLIVFDPIHHSYIQLGKKVGNDFSEGKALNNQNSTTFCLFLTNYNYLCQIKATEKWHKEEA